MIPTSCGQTLSRYLKNLMTLNCFFNIPNVKPRSVVLQFHEYAPLQNTAVTARSLSSLPFDPGLQDSKHGDHAFHNLFPLGVLINGVSWVYLLLPGHLAGHQLQCFPRPLYTI